MHGKEVERDDVQQSVLTESGKTQADRKGRGREKNNGTYGKAAGKYVEKTGVIVSGKNRDGENTQIKE